MCVELLEGAVGREEKGFSAGPTTGRFQSSVAALT